MASASIRIEPSTLCSASTACGASLSMLIGAVLGVRVPAHGLRPAGPRVRNLSNRAHRYRLSRLNILIPTAVGIASHGCGRRVEDLIGRRLTGRLPLGFATARASRSWPGRVLCVAAETADI